MTIAGLILTCVGIVTGISPPRMYAVWAPKDHKRRQLRLKIRYFASVALILVGTGLQIADAWGSK